ncbi:hypothetical protein B0J18DRAFT_353980, partial [Chaetomium sp. MPI-SDFR-AT-0129]
KAVTRTDEEEDVVQRKFEKILDYYGKGDNGRWQYLVKWVGHAPSWQLATDLRGCDDAIWEFHNSHPDSPGPPYWV